MPVYVVEVTVPIAVLARTPKAARHWTEKHIDAWAADIQDIDPEHLVFEVMPLREDDLTSFPGLWENYLPYGWPTKKTVEELVKEAK